MKTYTRKQAETILFNRNKFWRNCIDLCRINNEARKIDDTELYHASLDLNGYILGY